MLKKIISVLLGIDIFLFPISVMANETNKPVADKQSNIIFLRGTKETPKQKAILNNVETIFKGVQKVRQLTAKQPVNVGIKNHQELNLYLKDLMAKEYSAQDLEKDYILLERLGLIPKDTNLQEMFLNLYTEQIAGFYDDEMKALYLIENPKLGGLEFSVIISHELVHAIQDQYYDVKKVISGDKNSDITAARLALIEGEATIASLQYEINSFGLNAETLTDISSLLKNALAGTSQMPNINKAPGFLVEQMMFPYIEGSKFVQAIYDTCGSWEKFGDIYKKLPASTEQILHPDKYIQNEEPIKVELDENIITDKNWHFLEKDTMGEFFLQNYFLEYLDEGNAKSASSGWGGDKYLLFSGKEKNSLFIYKSLWDTDKDANEFFNAYIKSLQARYESNLKVNRESSDIYEAEIPHGKIFISMDKNAVTVQEGFLDLPFHI